MLTASEYETLKTLIAKAQPAARKQALVNCMSFILKKKEMDIPAIDMKN